MSVLRSLLLLSAAGSLLAAGSARAQTVTVQQPIVDVFSVNTVVSVPDRGSVLLGGVSRAADSRFDSTFVPVGSSLGMERSHSTVSASVYIHDFDTLDAELLATPTQTTAAPQRNTLASNAYRSLARKSAAAWSPVASGATPATATADASRFGRSPTAVKTQWSSSAESVPAASSRSTNSSDSPAANRASR